ncbi:MAG: hypothetical protein HY722_08345 [Planctomycetes bacterium]|nr:hypothetical protein [Planctomycetota bacterium]
MWGLAAVAMVLAFPGAAVTTTVLKYSNQELAEDAALILVGRCVGTESHWNDDRTGIYTDYTFEVSEFVKGERASRTVTIRQWGGVVGDRGYWIPGSTSYAANEEVFGFFTDASAESGCAWNVGLSQGKFTVKKDRVTRQKVLTRDLKGLSFFDPASQTVQEFSEENERKVFFEEFRSEVLRYVEKQRLENGGAETPRGGK